MSLDAAARESPVIGSVDDLVAWFKAGEKPVAQHRFGLETEKLGFVTATGESAPLEAVGRILGRFADAGGGTLLEEGGAAIGVQFKDYSVALEPGGQFELSGAPFHRLQQLETELKAHFADLKRYSEAEGLTWLATGFRPFGDRQAVPWLPRGRYGLMRQRMRGEYAHDMMQMTASVQASYDFSDEEDLAAKVSCATAVSPIVAAMFANSPIRDGKPAGMKSFRYYLWRDVDAPRCGLLRVMFEPGFTYERYVDWALGVPLLFIRRHGKYVDPVGKTLRDVIREGFAGEPATMLDFGDLISTLFPEIRVKRVIEVRGADAVDVPLSLAMPALWTGLLYDPQARAESRKLVNASFEELLAFQEGVGREALAARLGGTSARELAVDLVRIAGEGLQRRAVRGEGESTDINYLAPLLPIVESGRTPADDQLDLWARTGGDRDQVMAALRY
jgi:glutamate--cysteine ligase